MDVADRIVQAIERDVGDRQRMWDWGRDPDIDEEIRAAWRSLVLGILQEGEEGEST